MNEDGLDASISGLTGLLSGQRTLEETLTRVAQYAVQAVPGAEGAGLTLLQDDGPQTVVSTAPFVHLVDDIQYGIGEGPCISAVAECRTFTSGNLGGEAQWPRFGPRVGRLGIHSALSLPLMGSGRALGALNIYAHGKHVFGHEAVRVGEAFAPHAAVSVHNAKVLARAERMVVHLQVALVSRAEIDQAIGVIMARTGVGADEAFARLRTMSQSTATKLSAVAHDVVTEAVRSARAHGSTAALTGTPDPPG